MYQFYKIVQRYKIINRNFITQIINNHNLIFYTFKIHIFIMIKIDVLYKGFT
jgi:hypothetical protein